MNSADFKHYVSVSKTIALTEVGDKDRPALLEYLGEKSIFRQTFAIPYPYGNVEANWFLSRMKEKLFVELKPTTMAIRRTEDHKLIGVFGYHDFEPGDHKVEIGYWVGKPHWGQGIATQVVQRACGLAFEDFGVSRIYAKAFVRNSGSIRVLQKTGFQQEGLLRKEALKEGEYLDVAIFGLLKEDAF